MIAFNALALGFAACSWNQMLPKPRKGTLVVVGEGDTLQKLVQECEKRVGGTDGCGEDIDWKDVAILNRLSPESSLVAGQAVLLPTLETALILRREFAKEYARLTSDSGSTLKPASGRPVDRISGSSSNSSDPDSGNADVDAVPAGRLRALGRFFALLVGIEKYPGLPAVDYAERDVATLKEYLMTSMGYPEENVVVLTGQKATKSGIQKYLEEWLPRNTDAKSRVLVFFAGHGAPDPASGDAFLVPFDGDPSFLQTTGLKLKDFYASLEKLPAKDVIVLADACFSGAGGRSVLAKGARPLVTQVDSALSPGSKITAIAASSGSEITASYEEKGHGLFTYFLLKGLRGDADKDGDGWVTLGEAYDYLKPNVQKMARRQNREQTPQLLPGIEALGKKFDLKLAKVK